MKDFMTVVLLLASVDLRSWVLNRIVRMPHIEMLDYLWELG